MAQEPYEIDQDRLAESLVETPDTSNLGLLVRVKNGPGWDVADAYALTRESLLRWLRSRGGKNLWAENIIMDIMGYDHFDEPEAEAVCAHQE